MSVKVVEIYLNKWYVRVVYKNFRKTKRIGSKERAIEVSRKLTTALKLYGLDAWKIFQDGSDLPVKSEPVLPTIAEYQSKWFEELDRTDLKRSTKDNCRYLLTRHIDPAFGKERLDSIDYPKLKAWVIRQSGKYSKDTVRVMMQEAVEVPEALRLHTMHGPNGDADR